jgi:uncharacterized membrane protein YphA (DoxX/SURF4 family)
MNHLDWFVQILLAGIFLFAGLSKLFAFQRKAEVPQTGPSCRGFGLPSTMAVGIALLEIAGALALVVPLIMWQPAILPLAAATGFALLSLAICVYHYRRGEFTAPVVALFLLSLFVIIGNS